MNSLIEISGPSPFILTAAASAVQAAVRKGRRGSFGAALASHAREATGPTVEEQLRERLGAGGAARGWQ